MRRSRFIIIQRGWKTKKDDQGVIEALEGLQVANGPGFPQGSKVLRKEDHSGMIDCYISRVEKNQLNVKKKVTKEELVARLLARFDLSKQAV